MDRRWISPVLLASTVCLLSAAPALAAQPADRGPTPGLGWGPGGSKGVPGPLAGAGLSLPFLLASGSKGAPGPLTGVGLPFLLAAGAFGAFQLSRRRRV